MKMQWKFNDGGRHNYFKASGVGDCLTRALAIALGADYKETYMRVKHIVGYTPRNGIRFNDVHRVVEAFGGTWHACMSKGSGCKVHLADGELPADRPIVCRLSGHLTAVVNGVNYDIFDPSRGGSRCVYGYWDF